VFYVRANIENGDVDRSDGFVDMRDEVDDGVFVAAIDSEGMDSSVLGADLVDEGG